MSVMDDIPDDYASPFAPRIDDDEEESFQASKAKLRFAARTQLSKPLPREEGIGRAIALYDFKGVQVGH